MVPPPVPNPLAASAATNESSSAAAGGSRPHKQQRQRPQPEALDGTAAAAVAAAGLHVVEAAAARTAAAGSNDAAAAGGRRKKSRWGPSASTSTSTSTTATAAAAAADEEDQGQSSSSSSSNSSSASKASSAESKAKVESKAEAEVAAVATKQTAATATAAAGATGSTSTGGSGGGSSTTQTAQSKTKPGAARPNRWGSPLAVGGGPPHVLGPPPPVPHVQHVPGVPFGHHHHHHHHPPAAHGLPPPGFPGGGGRRRPPPPPPPGHPAHAAHAARAHAQAHAQAHGLPPPMYYAGGPYRPVGYQQNAAASGSASSSASGKSAKGKKKATTPKIRSKSKTAKSSSRASSKAKSASANAKAKRPRSRSSSASASASASTSASASPAQQQQQQQNAQPPPPPVVGPPQGYGPVGPPPLPYHEAQLLLGGPSMHDLPCGVVVVGGGKGEEYDVRANVLNGDNRTLEWEAHAEALALGLGLLDDDADDPTCSVAGTAGSHPHDAYLQHGPPPAAEAGTADAETTRNGSSGEGMDVDVNVNVDVDEPAENDDAATRERPTGGSAPPAAAAVAAHEDGESVAPIDGSLVPILTLQGYCPRSSKAATAGNNVREQFAKARECHGNAAGDNTGATTSLAEDGNDQEREERRRVQLQERLGRRRTADGDDPEHEFRRDLAGVWYPHCSWIAADDAGTGTTCGSDRAIGTGKNAGAAAVVDPSPPMIRRRQASQSSVSAPSAVPAQGRKRSRPAGSVSFSLGNTNGDVRGTGLVTPKQLEQQVLQSLPSSSDLLSDTAYIDLVCGSAAKGEACTSLLASLLDAMGMELQTKQRRAPAGSRASLSSGVSASVDSHARPMREGKKPVQTPATVRDFAATLISMGVQQAVPLATASTDSQFTVLDEVAAAFRLACHHVLRYVASALASTNISKDNKSPVRRKKATKVSEFARRAYMTLFVTLRGLIVRIVDRPDSAESTDVDDSILSFFATTNCSHEDGDGEARPSFSTLERLLLDVIPLLTRFAQPPLHDKHSTSLMSNLLLLDGSTRLKKSKRSKDPTRGGSIVIVRDGLMELFVRQLVDQEDLTERRLRKLLNVSSNHLSDVTGAAASLHPKPSSGCILASDGIVEYRRQQQGDLEAIARQKASATSISTLASATAARSVSSSWDTEDAARSGATATVAVVDSDNDLRLVRIDGCIYLSKIISRLLDSRPSKSSSPSPPSSSQAFNKTDSSTVEDDDAGRMKISSATSASSNFAASSELKIKASEEKVRVHDTQKIEGVAQTAYFLFHTLVESHDAVGSFPRKKVSSAVLACFLLAGKMEDCPLKLRTILRITKNATLPPPPFETVRQCYDKLTPNAPGVLPMKWGEPSAELIKQFEFSLLTTLGFVMPEDPQSLHPTASIIEIKNKLALDSDTMKHMHRLMKDPCYTHSSLCLLREPQLMAAALYYLSCQKGRVELLKNWDLVLEEEAVVVKVVADYSRWVGHCVKYRERQWNVFKTLKYRVNTSTKTTGSSVTSESRGSTPDTIVDDSLAVWSRTIPPISEFEAPPLLPTELSTVTEKINDLLSDPDPEESSSPEEVQDEDYLTLAALLEIPDDAVEDSDTSPSTNSVDSIAVLMDSHSKEASTTCSKADGANGGGGDDNSKQIGSNETTMVVSPALGDDRHDAVLSEGDTNTEAVSSAAAQPARNVAVVDRTKDVTDSVEKSTDTTLEKGSAEEGRGSVHSSADGVIVDQESSTITGEDMASTVPFSPIRRKSISSNPFACEIKGSGRELRADVEVPDFADASETKFSDTEKAKERNKAKANVTSTNTQSFPQDNCRSSSKADSDPTASLKNGCADSSSELSLQTPAADDQEKSSPRSTHKAAPSSTADKNSTKPSAILVPVSSSMGPEVQKKKQGTSPDPVSSPVLAARPAPALPPAPTSPKKKILMKAAEDEAAAEAEAESAACAGEEGTASLSGTINASSKATKPADNAKLPPIVAPYPTPKVANTAASKAVTSNLLASPELSTNKKNSTLKDALTPRRAAAASSLLELKIASKLASTVESISRNGSPVPPSKEDTPKPSRRATRSAVKAGKSPQPDAKGLVKKSAKKKAPASTSRKRRAAKTTSDVIEKASALLEKEEKKKGATKFASSRQSEDSVPTRPLKKRALSTSEEPAVPFDSEKVPSEEEAVAPEPSKVTDLPLPQATGTTPSWYPAPNLQRLEAQANQKGRGKKRTSQEVSTSDTPSGEKSTARPTATKRRKSPRTAVRDTSPPKSRSEEKKPKDLPSSSSMAATLSKDGTSVISDTSILSQKGSKKGASEPKAKDISVPEAVPKDEDDNFAVANDIDNGEDAPALDQEADRIAKARARYDFSTATLKKTAPLYKNDLFCLEDKNEQPLICELASLHREAAIHFIDTMKRKVDAFWLDERVATRAAEAFWFQLPPRVQTEEARHLYRNFADSLDDLRDTLPLETPDKPLRLRLSRREVDIMLYFVSKGQTAMDCHYLMPYRSRRKIREVYESIRMLIGDVKEEYMANVNTTVEALIAIEGPHSRKEDTDTQNVIMLC